VCALTFAGAGYSQYGHRWPGPGEDLERSGVISHDYELIPSQVSVTVVQTTSADTVSLSERRHKVPAKAKLEAKRPCPRRKSWHPTRSISQASTSERESPSAQSGTGSSLLNPAITTSSLAAIATRTTYQSPSAFVGNRRTWSLRPGLCPKRGARLPLAGMPASRQVNLLTRC
jgi:hypothetical protein